MTGNPQSVIRNPQFRVLHLAKEAGTLRLFMLPVCDAMRAAGAQVELACMHRGPNYDPLDQAGYPLHGLYAGGWKSPRTWRVLYKQIRTLLREGRYDLMVVHTPVISWIARAAARGLVPTVVYMAHGLPFAPQQRPLKRWVYRRVESFVGRWNDGIIVMNEADAMAAQRYRLSRTGLWFKVPGVGLDVGAWSQPIAEPLRQQVLRQFGLSADKPIVLYMGRFVSDKRPGDILECARRVGPKAQFVLAGEGPLWESSAIRAAAIGPHVHVLPFTDLARPLLQCASLVAFPSVYIEGLPRVLLEAQAAGKPPVAYDIRGSHDAIVHNKTGMLVPPRDVNGFCKAVGSLLDDPARREQLAVAGRQWVQQTFSLDASVAAQLSALREVCRAKGTPAPW